MSASGDDVVLTAASGTELILSNQMAYSEHNVFSYVEFVYTDTATGEETSEVFVVNPEAPAVPGGIVTVLGTDKNDVIDIPNDNAASLVGLKGNDVLGGAAQKDLVDGGEGEDFIWGGAGSDTLIGSEVMIFSLEI